MKFVIDADIPFAGVMFAGRAEVRAIPGSRITPDEVRGADVLIVRSVTKVTERLLGDHRPRFVGTATIGTDHLDLPFLESRGIPFANAPGCNSVSVAEYLVAALLEVAGRRRFLLEGKSLGVVGDGNVGSRVAARAAALGMNVLLNDPPRAERGEGGPYRPLEEVLAADIVTLHVPLTRGGRHATYHLLDGKKFAAMKRGAILINTSRGAVVDTAALKSAIGEKRIAAAVLDVWEGEPAIDTGAVGLGEICTPHIAGYSADGKARGAVMIYREVCRVMGWRPEWSADGLLPPPEHPRLDPPAADPEEFLRSVVRACYPIMRDDAALRKISALPSGEREAWFSGLRDNYPLRREFAATTVGVPSPMKSVSGVLGALGFTVASLS